MRSFFACVLVSTAVSSAGCANLEFGTGGQGGDDTSSNGPGPTGTGGASTGSTATSTATGTGGAPATTAGTGGATATTGSTTATTGGGPDCTNKRCGDDGNGGLCNGKAMSDHWGIAVPGEVLAIAPWPETQSLFISTANDHVLRIDECDGSVMADQIDTTGLDGQPFLFGLGYDATQVTVIAAHSNDFGNPNRRYFLNLTSLAVTGSDNLANQFGNDAGDAFTDAAGIHVNFREGGQGFAPFVGDECSQKFGGFNALEARGIVRTAQGLYVTKWSNTNGVTTMLGSLGACVTSCNCPDPVEATTSVGVLANALADNGGDIVGVGTNLMARAYLVHVNPTTLAPSGVRSVDIGPTGPDALLTVVASGGFVFAGGATSLGSTAEAYSREPTGSAILVRAPSNFDGSTNLTEHSMTGGSRTRKVAADATGIYAGGLKLAGTGGFLVKCTTGLTCGSVP